jgi:hypothetical protein
MAISEKLADWFSYPVIETSVTECLECGRSVDAGEECPECGGEAIHRVEKEVPVFYRDY